MSANAVTMSQLPRSESTTEAEDSVGDGASMLSVEKSSPASGSSSSLNSVEQRLCPSHAPLRT